MSAEIFTIKTTKARCTNPRLEILVIDYYDGTMAPSSRRKFEQHLKGCVACRANLHNLTEVMRALRSLLRST